jgi:hypothetical protein
MMIETEKSFLSTKNTIPKPKEPVFPSIRHAPEKQGAGSTKDHFEPRQPCKICKHINADEDEHPCSECKHNPRA